MDSNTIKRKRYVYLFAAAASFLVLGLVYAWSLFATPLATIYGWEMSAVKMTFTFCMMSFCVGGLIGVRVLRRLGLKGAVLLAAALLVCGFAGTSLLAPQGIWALYLCYGVLIGCGTGLCYNVVIASVTPWFPDRHGFASGILFMGFGLGSLTLGTLTNAIIGMADIATAFAVVATTAGVVFVALALFLKRPPENIEELVGSKKKTVTSPHPDADKRTLFRDPAFYSYYLWATIILGAGLVIIGTSKQGAIELGISDQISTLLVGVIPIVSGLSGLCTGVIYDRMGLTFSLTLSATISFVSSTALALAFWLGLGPVYVIGGITLVVSYGSVSTLAPAFARERYGVKRFPKHLAIVNTDIAGGSAFQQVVTSACGGSSPLIYTTMAVFGAIALLTSRVIARLAKSKR